MQQDLGSMVSSLHYCESPSHFPKTLVFCRTKFECVKVYNLLSKPAHLKSMVSMYHATLFDETKHFLHGQFTQQASDLSCLVSTVAFGMERILIFIIALPPTVSL